MVDYFRQESRARLRWRLKWTALTLVAASLIAGPYRWFATERDAIAISEIRVAEVREESIQQVIRGLGQPQPQHSYWVTAPVSGTVVRIEAQPGEMVQKGQILIGLANPQLELEALEARTQVQAAKARLRELEQQIQQQLLTQKGHIEHLAGEYYEAELQAERDRQLHAMKLLSEMDLNVSLARAERLRKLLEFEKEKLKQMEEAGQAQLAAQRAEIEHLEALLEYRLDQQAHLQVRAQISGIVEEIPVQVGEIVHEGSRLVRLVDPARLEAHLQVNEREAGQVSLEMPAKIQIAGQSIRAKVSRVEPVAREGLVTVVLVPVDPLPHQARPSLSVEAEIEAGYLRKTLVVERPPGTFPHQSTTVLRIDGENHVAVSVPVRFGLVAGNKIQIIEGLHNGDKIVLTIEAGRYPVGTKLRLVD